MVAQTLIFIVVTIDSITDILKNKYINCFRIWPTLCDNYIYIESCDNICYTVYIENINGQQLYKKEYCNSNQEKINFSDLNNGLYLIKIIINNYNEYITKVIKI